MSERSNIPGFTPPRAPTPSRAGQAKSPVFARHCHVDLSDEDGWPIVDDTEYFRRVQAWLEGVADTS